MRKRLRISIALRSPFLFQGLDPAAHGFDASAIRDENNRLMIPGDHLRGHLRHALSVLLAGSPAVEALFGKASASPDGFGGAQNKPEPGALIVGDLHASDMTSGVYHRVAINDETGAAETGMLQVIELPAPIGESVLFEGDIVVRPMAHVPQNIEQVIVQAMKLIPAMGAAKSAGFGEVASATCILAPATAPIQLASDSKLTLRVAFDRPVLVNSRRDANNIFVSDTVIPGAAIRGTLAAALLDAGVPLTDSDRLPAISHAFPVDADGTFQDRAMPLSLALVESESGVLAAADAFDVVGFDALASHGTASFVLDWKKAWEHAGNVLRRPASGIKHLPRGRVMINSQGVAEESALFVVAPIETCGREWQFDIDFTGVDPKLQSAIRTQLACGLDGIGRTGARMVVVSSAASPQTGIFAQGQTIRVLLETPTVMTDPRDGMSARIQYKRYFKLIGADLVEVVAQRALAGEYFGYRFRGYGNAYYQPFEITLPGAIFIVSVTDGAKFSAAVARGLPAVRGETVGGNLSGNLEILDWKHCPFVAENGYGAISIIDDAEVERWCRELPKTAVTL